MIYAPNALFGIESTARAYGSELTASGTDHKVPCCGDTSSVQPHGDWQAWKWLAGSPVASSNGKGKVCMLHHWKS